MKRIYHGNIFNVPLKSLNDSDFNTVLVSAPDELKGLIVDTSRESYYEIKDKHTLKEKSNLGDLDRNELAYAFFFGDDIFEIVQSDLTGGVVDKAIELAALHGRPVCRLYMLRSRCSKWIRVSSMF